MKLNWILLSFIALFALSFMSFLITLLTRRGYPTSFVLLGIGIIFTLFFSFHTFILLKYRPEFTVGIFILLILIGFLGVLGNIALFQAANNAPNPGLAIAISAGMQAGVVALMAFLFLKDKLSILQIIGMLLAFISVFLITVGHNQDKDDKLSTKNNTINPSQRVK